MEAKTETPELGVPGKVRPDSQQRLEKRKEKGRGRKEKKNPDLSFSSLAKAPQEIRVDLPVTVSLNNDVTVAEADLAIWLNDPRSGQRRFYHRVAKGASKRNRGDEPNSVIGAMLAVSRALTVLANRVQRTAQGYVNHQDWLAEQRKKDKLSPEEIARRRKEALELSRRRSEQRRADKERKVQPKKTRPLRIP